MKRNWKSLMVSGTVLTVLAGALTLPALASVGQRTAALHYQNIKVTLDGRTLDLTDSRGNEVEPSPGLWDTLSQSAAFHRLEQAGQIGEGHAHAPHNRKRQMK